MNKGASHHSGASKSRRKGKDKDKGEPRQQPRQREVLEQDYSPGEEYGFPQVQQSYSGSGQYFAGGHGQVYHQSHGYSEEPDGQYSREQDLGDDGTTVYPETGGSHYTYGSQHSQYDTTS